MSWHFSRALVEEYSAGSYSAGAPFVRSKLIRMQRGVLRRVKTTDAWSLSQFGTTLRRSTGGPGTALLTWFLEAFRARTSAQPAKVLESPESEVDSGENLRGSFVKWDRASLSWKTHQFSLLGGLESFSETWPRWGMMQDGACWEHSTPARHTSENESGYWQTPVADDAVQRKDGKFNSRGEPKLSAQVLFPTPRSASKSGGGIGLDGGRGSREMIQANHGPEAVKDLTGGSLNPTWVEWLMGWPIGWTDCAASGTGKFQQWQQQHGSFYTTK